MRGCGATLGRTAGIEDPPGLEPVDLRNVRVPVQDRLALWEPGRQPLLTPGPRAGVVEQSNSPPASRTRSRGNLCATAGSSMLPCTPSTGGPSASSSARNAIETKSPRCRIRSAARSRSHAGGSRREPRGRCVSEMTATPVAAVYRTVKTKLTNTLVRAGFIAARSLTAKTYRPGGTARSKLRTRTL